MKQNLESLLTRLQQVRNLSDLDSAIRAIREFYDVEHVIYHSASQTQEPFLALTYDQVWIDRYLGKNYARIDPVVQGAMKRFHPVEWKQLDWSSKTARNFMGEATSAGVGNQGLSIPLRGPGGQFALFTVSGNSTDQRWEKFCRESTNDLVLLSHYINQSVLEMNSEDVVESSKALSPREVDALSYLASGRSRAQIAETLGISEHTLRVYIESARLKLGATNTTHAVALALTGGLIIL